MSNLPAIGLGAEEHDLAWSIVNGEDPVRRLVTMKYFTYAIDGEDVIFDDKMRARIELACGSALHEVVPEGFEADRVLRFDGDEEAIRSRLADF